MKKLTALLLVFIAAFSLYAVDFDFVIGQKTGASLEFENASNMRTSFNFNVDAELDMDFHEGHGMAVSVNPYSEGGSVEFALGVGYAYKTDISSYTDFLFSVGPVFTFSSAGAGFGVFLNADFSFDLGDIMFVRVGTGIDIDLGTFGKSTFGREDLRIVIPLPYFGIGWRF